ncbi:N-acetylmuramoyl-L-alanine amidase [Amedibacterium intestinale]|uniref:N-acetylmuramoyl-L-alanine amidase n=1 Tax=Amedibacterium intestinale TaxID=2583452 RepID=UPI000E2075FC
MNILLLNGHGAGDSGATGNGYQEQKLTRELADLVETRLKKYAKVYRYPKERNAFADVEIGTFKSHLPISYGSIGYALEIHFNAFKKDETKDGRKKGSEIYVTTRENGITVEQAIMRGIGKYFPLRDNDNVFDGVKRTNFLVINTLKNNGVSGALLETCFIDDADDMETYQKNKNEIADAIVHGIVSEFGLKSSSSESKPSNPKPQPSTETKYKVGDTVNINGIYTSSTSTGKLKPAKTSGKITKIVTGARNPYLLDNGNLGWVNEGCIIGKKGSTLNSKTLKVGMKAKPKKAMSYDGVKLDSFVTKEYFKVIEIKGNRVVLGDGLNTAFNIDNLIY